MPIELSKSNGITTQFFSFCNLSHLHKQALSIHPEWLNGLNVQLKLNFDINEGVFNTFSVLNATGTSSFQYGIECSSIDRFNLMQKPSSVRLILNPGEQSTAFLFHCYPSFSSTPTRLILKNNLNASRLFNENIDNKLSHLITSIRMKNCLQVDWFGQHSRVSCAVHTLDSTSITTSLSILKNILPNFQIGAELMADRNGQPQQGLSLNPFFATAYENQHSKIAGTVNLKSMKVDLSCLNHVNDQIQVGSTLIIDPKSNNAIASVFGQCLYGDLIVRGKIASNGFIGTTCDYKFGYFTMKSSILTNIFTQKCICGITIQFD